MTIQQIDPNLIDPNPYQPATRLTFTPAQLADLDSIRDIGLLQIPRARPIAGDRFQIIYGWRRRCAWLYFRPGEPMPLDVVEATDAELFEQSAIENGQRQDLSAIEKAGILRRAIDEFGMTQIQAGRLVGLASQGAVSNILRLLELPEPARQLVHSGDVPERLARELVPLVAANPAVVTAMATKIAKATPAQKEDAADGSLHIFFRTGKNNARRLRDTEWPPDWPGAPIPAKLSDNRKPQSVRQCKNCPFSMKYNEDPYCTRPACFDAKCDLWAEREVERVSAKLHIPAARADEKVEVVYYGQYSMRDREFATKALSAKHESLRLARYSFENHHYDYGSSESLRSQYFGSSAIMLSTTNMAALKKACKLVPSPKTTSSTDDWQVREAERRKRIAKNNKACRALIAAAAPHLTTAMPIQPAMLDLLFGELKYRLDHLNEAEAKWKSATIDTKRAMLISSLLSRHINITPYNDTPPDRARQKIEILAKQMLIKLPAKWAASAETEKTPPQRKTASRGKKK